MFAKFTGKHFNNVFHQLFRREAVEVCCVDGKMFQLDAKLWENEARREVDKRSEIGTWKTWEEVAMNRKRHESGMCMEYEWMDDGYTHRPTNDCAWRVELFVRAHAGQQNGQIRGWHIHEVHTSLTALHKGVIGIIEQCQKIWGQLSEEWGIHKQRSPIRTFNAEMA